MTGMRERGRISPLVGAATVFVVFLIASAAIVRTQEVGDLRADRGQAASIAAGYAQLINRNVYSSMSAAYALAALVREGSGQIRNLDEVARDMLPLYPGVRHVALSPGGIVAQVAPLKGNEKAIGFKQFEDPFQGAEAGLARASGELSMAGPLNLVQGGLAVVGRLPVFLDAEDSGKKTRFWGFTNVVVGVPALLASARLERLERAGLSYELWRINPATRRRQLIASSTVHSLADPVETSIAVPNGVWTLSVEPARGWTNYYRLGLRSFIFVAVSFLIALSTKLLIEARRNEHELAALVAARDGQIREREAAQKELESFAYSVSHDLRAPLRAVDGFSQILIEDYAAKLDDEGKRIIGAVHSSARKMGQMIEDVLAFSRLGRTEMTRAPVDMEEIVRTTLKELEPVTKGRDIAFDIGPLPPASGDAAMIQRIWTNLLDNAVKFTKPKDAAVIEVRAHAEADETIYQVKDNGIGFDMQHVDRLFGVFQRLHGEEIPGTGVGLANVKRIVTRHGGRVWAEGRPGEGASFYFTLPSGPKAAGYAPSSLRT